MLVMIVIISSSVSALVPSPLLSSVSVGRHRTQLGVVVTSDGGDSKKFMYMTPEQDQLLVQTGNHEASLMTKVQPLSPNKIKIRSKSAAGFGKATIPAVIDPDDQRQLEAEAHAKALEREGLVRIDNVLTPELADALKEYLVDLRARGTKAIECGTILDSRERFADVLLNQNRCDLKVPLGPDPVNHAMHHLLHKTVLRNLIEFMFDKYGGGGNLSTLYELNCFMSNTGARRQLVHSDNACVENQVGLHPKEPIMLTCFVALQDTDKTMGPTTWIPRTHNVESHRLFYQVDNDGTNTNNGKQPPQAKESTKDKLLRTSKAVMGTLPKGACAIFDPRVLHCAGANNCKDPNDTRAMFYFSFKNPRVDNPGCPSCSGYGIVNAEIPMQVLCDELDAKVSGTGPSPRLDSISCFP